MIEAVPLEQVAEQYGTPAYVYSRRAIENAWRGYDRAFGNHPHLVCYAVKANSNLGVLSVLARLGSGFDIVSGGELARVLAAGGDAGKVVFSGVGKSPDEMARALEVGIRCFNVESRAELSLLSEVAQAHGAVAPVSVRVNPDVDPKTHPYISTGLKESKFGIPIDEARETYALASELPGVRVVGVDCHIGSQLTDDSPLLDALDRLLILVDELADAGIGLDHLDLGGGIGIDYAGEEPPRVDDYISQVLERLGDRPLEIMLEPGRSIVGNAGCLLTRVSYIKRGEEKAFAIVDAAMNDLARPALYDAWHDVELVSEPSQGEAGMFDLVGPICESGDFIAKARAMNLAPGDLLAIMSTGAYGFAMSSNYNTRPRAAEVLVSGSETQLVRKRETIESLFADEFVAD
ncbi:MAG: diaminopimelate decarboxylase [Gammaproteobacteria bacterium]